MISLRRKASAENLPTGCVVPFAGMTAPEGFLLLGAAPVSRATYADLFTTICSVNNNISLTSGTASISGFVSTSNFAIGMALSGNGIPSGATISVISGPTSLIMSANATLTTTTVVVVAPYGVGDGVSTFNLPTSPGRAMIGAGTYSDPVTGSVTRTLGSTLGAERHQLSVAEMPSHQHGTLVGFNNNVNNSNFIPPMANNNDYGTRGTSFTGGNGTHNNMQPSLVTNFIIKF